MSSSSSMNSEGGFLDFFRDGDKPVPPRKRSRRHHRSRRLRWKCCRHVATCRRRHDVSLQFWPDGSVSPTQN
jgi:hypothetical protein